MRESRRAKRLRARAIYSLLSTEYPDARCALDHRGAYQLTVATILSAQCTDARVNQVTPAFFERFPGPGALSLARKDEVEDLIHSTGFFRNKAKNLIGMAIAVQERHGGTIPDTMEALVGLPGVGRKTANVILGNAFRKSEGVVVDTHVGRLSRRLCLSAETNPVRIEQDLIALFPRDGWTLLSHLLIFHGRAVCAARKARCEACVLVGVCPSSKV